MNNISYEPVEDGQTDFSETIVTTHKVLCLEYETGVQQRHYPVLDASARTVSLGTTVRNIKICCGAAFEEKKFGHL